MESGEASVTEKRSEFRLHRPEGEQVEPWLRGTLTEVDAVRRQVLHALELAAEDASHWCEGMSDQEMHARPLGLASVAFHLRHMARSLDRLLTYVEGGALTDAQRISLESEMDPGESAERIIGEFTSGLVAARKRVLRILPETFDQVRWVGRKKLTTTAGGLVVHCAEHTQRHAGQMVTTAKVVRAAAQAVNRI